MTTIAFRDGILAMDGASTRAGWMLPEHVRKAYRAKDGRIVTFSGDFAQCRVLAEWLLKDPKKGNRPTLGEGAGAVIEIRGIGRARVYEERGWFDVRGDFLAWGSGSPAAYAAMMAGADAPTAVRIAAKLDPGTGGRITVLRL